MKPNHEKYLKKLSKLLKQKPEELIFYCIDDTLSACVRGIPTNGIDTCLVSGIRAGTMLTDIHDDMNNGEY